MCGVVGSNRLHAQPDAIKAAQHRVSRGALLHGAKRRKRAALNADARAGLIPTLRRRPSMVGARENDMGRARASARQRDAGGRNETGESVGAY